MNHRISNRRRWSRAGRAAIVIVGLAAMIPCSAQSIPVWLDDAITEWNQKNPDTPLRFVDIKDSFVWYTVPATEEIGPKEIRERVYGLVGRNGYEVTAEEELVTTAKPPSPNEPYKPKKCWRRSFVKNMDGQSNTKAVGGGRSGMSQRMLTSLVCEDYQSWFTGFRIAQ
jgi:hypothetical protein